VIDEVVAAHDAILVADDLILALLVEIARRDYGPGDLFFETGDINHTVFNKTDAPMVHVLFEILPADQSGPSLIPVKHH
jgi:hypothetical protein